MQRLVLDAGLLIALVSQQDRYHAQAVDGFQDLSKTFGEVITPLPIVFEVYKFVSRNTSVDAAKLVLTFLKEETIIHSISEIDFWNLFELVIGTKEWSGTLEDASVLITAQEYQGQVWTIDYKDLGYFKNISFWNPN